MFLDEWVRICCAARDIYSTDDLESILMIPEEMEVLNIFNGPGYVDYWLTALSGNVVFFSSHPPTDYKPCLS